MSVGSRSQRAQLLREKHGEKNDFQFLLSIAYTKKKAYSQRRYPNHSLEEKQQMLKHLSAGSFIRLFFSPSLFITFLGASDLLLTDPVPQPQAFL